MNTNQLECFITLSSTLNYARCAEELHLTQPAVSKQIKSLEKELGCELFYRTTRSVELSEIGNQFLPEAKSMLDTYYHSKEWINNYKINEYHSFKIGYTDPQSIKMITQALSDMYIGDATLSPKLVYNQTNTNLQALSNHFLDVVVCMKDALFKDSHISFEPIHHDGFVFIISKEHDAYHTFKDLKAVHTSDLCPLEQVIALPPYLLKSYFSRGRTLLPVNNKLNNIICENVNEAYGLVKAGFGFALVPEFQVVEDEGILTLPWLETPRNDFGIYYFNGADLSLTKEFIKAVKDYYK